MVRAMRLIPTLSLALFFHLAIAAQTTTIVSVTATTTVTQTASNTGDGSGACDNFYGACVVYGSYGDSAAYTTTVYGTSPTSTPHTSSSTFTLVTSTTTFQRTTTVGEGAGGACQDYDGACVVYGSAGSPTTTVYAATSTRGGNADGEIGQGSNQGEGQIGGAGGLSGTAAVVLGLGFGVLAFWL